MEFKNKSIKHTVQMIAVLLLLLPFLVPTDIDAANRLGNHPAAWKFAVVSDTQGNNKEGENGSCINDEIVRAIAEDIARERPDFVLVSGDLVNGWFRNGGVDFADQYASWQEAMGPVYRGRIRIYPIRGNHDSGPERLVLSPLPAKYEPQPGALERLEQAYKKAFPKVPQNGPRNEKGLTYSFGHKNAFIIGLDQYTAGQHKINQAWLDGQLAKAGKRHIFVYGHEPAFEAGHEDNLSFFPRERNLFWDSLGRAGARAYFCGHDHFYNRASISDSQGHEIRQVIAGTGGGAPKSWSGSYKDKRVKGEYYDAEHRGYLLITIEGSRAIISWKAIVSENGAVTWKVLDSFAYDIAAGESY